MSIAAVFFDVDTQHDFMDEDGRLAVPDAASIVPNLEKLTRFAVERRIPILASADAHPSDDPEFEQFGRHCVVGTPGQSKIDATSAEGCEVADPSLLDDQVGRLVSGETAQLIIEKRELDVFTVPAAAYVPARLEPRRVFVYGVTTEYCVRAAVLGLREHGYDVTVVTDAVKAISAEDGERALAEMLHAGADTADTQAVLDLLSRSAGT